MLGIIKLALMWRRWGDQVLKLSWQQKSMKSSCTESSVKAWKFSDVSGNSGTLTQLSMQKDFIECGV